MIRNLLLALLVTALPASFAGTMVRAEDPPPPSDGRRVQDSQADVDVMDILRRADKATKAVSAVAYEAEYRGEGQIADRVPRVVGRLQAREPKKSLISRIVGGSSARESLRIEAKVRMPGDKERVLKLATDGVRIAVVDEKSEIYTYGQRPEAEELLEPAGRLFMLEFLHPTPFSDELNGKSVEYEGVQDVEGVKCHVIYVVYANDSESRWYFGCEDYLPRRVDRIIKAPGIEGATVLTVAKLDVQPKLEPQDFALERPKGFKKVKYERKAPPPPPPLLAVGARAPEWELKTPDGRTVSLRGLRGNIVVMDFWATWCGPCKLAMPAVQKLHEEFKGESVKVFGVNCWESGDAAAFMKDKGYTYGLLLEADEVATAYRVSGIPTFYVIDREGRVLYAASGFSPDREKQIAEVIRSALDKGGDTDRATSDEEDQDENADSEADGGTEE